MYSYSRIYNPKLAARLQMRWIYLHAHKRRNISRAFYRKILFPNLVIIFICAVQCSPFPSIQQIFHIIYFGPEYCNNKHVYNNAEFAAISQTKIRRSLVLEYTYINWISRTCDRMWFGQFWPQFCFISFGFFFICRLCYLHIFFCTRDWSI